MNNTSETHIHIHIHEGVTPEAAAAAAAAAYGAVNQEPESGAPLLEVSPPNEEDRRRYIERAYEESEGGAKPLLEYLAENPDRPISFPEISEALGYDTPRSLPGLLGSFGRRAKHRYQGVKPFESEWVIDQWYLSMTAENAEIINALRG